MSIRNLKARGMEHGERLPTSLFENPEITAMAAICEILQDLPDDAARMRVMRWSFGRFGTEFKLPLPDALPAVVPPAVVPPAVMPAAAVASLAVEPVTVVEVSAPVSRPWPPVVQEQAMVREPAPLPAAAQADALSADLARQVSELKDLFPAGRPSGGILTFP